MALDAFKMMGEKMGQAGNDLKALRGVMEGMSGFPSAGETKCTPVTAGGVPAEWIAATGAADDRVILYVHGGGYVMGSIATHRELVARLSKASGARGLALDYRLAPEHPFPAAVDDALAAYRWLLSQNIKPSNIVVAGDSAGGGLAVATLLAIRDAKLPLPAAGVGISPWVDMEGLGESMTTRAKVDPVVQKQGLLGMAQLYLGGKDAKSPLAAPLHADLAGLPPLLIQVGDAETLLSDSTRLAEKAKKAGVKVELEVWPEMPHVWHLFAPFLPEGQQAIEKIGKYVRQITA
ncbi:MAG: alpha/beta hydrolase [Deltaproteobacteria bacterium]|nr:alpha/beta hydrolase [Deltaproteobacteria bacterium]